MSATERSAPTLVIPQKPLRRFRLMFASDAEKWAKFSKLGRKRFVLYFGVLGWGLPTAILFTLLQTYELGWDGFLVRLIVAAVFFPIGGVAVGHCMWKWLERKRAKTPPAHAAK
jgi:hypothetical protein